ncbi:MAG: peptidase, partial [Gammaproteobacteria bacterium]|nr:peptidase [Gammaproteobacteria bacterium]
LPSNGAEAVIRAGQYRAGNSDLSSALLGDWQTIGWTSMPADAQVQLRMSGLLWPEASQRILNTAYLVRESVGRGQLIMFANEANFRGAALGSRRMLLNALVLGPGMGTDLHVEL